MSAEGPQSDWPGPVIGYLAGTLPPLEHGGRVGWEHMFASAWQFGVMALVALGHAEEHGSGAWRIDTPRRPEVLPRWDDICRVVLCVATQTRAISYRLPDGSVYEPPRTGAQFTVRRINPEGQKPVVPAANIAAAYGLGPALAATDRDMAERAAQMEASGAAMAEWRKRAGVPASELDQRRETAVAPAVFPVLEALGLVRDGAWTAEAELVLWRAQPRAWDMAVEDDDRFRAGLERCLATMPQEIVETMHDRARITAEDVAAAVAWQEAHNGELHARQGRTVTAEGQLRGLVFRAESAMDDLFFEGWRLEDGWLSRAETSRALPLFHDPLARQMRAAAGAAMGLCFPMEVSR